MIDLKWLPSDEAVQAEVERQAGHRAQIAALDAQIKAIQARSAEARALLDKRPEWASDYGWMTARQQLRGWEAAARSQHPLYLDGDRVREARNGCLYWMGSSSPGQRYERDGDRIGTRPRIDIAPHDQSRSRDRTGINPSSWPDSVSAYTSLPQRYGVRSRTRSPYGKPASCGRWAS